MEIANRDAAVESSSILLNLILKRLPSESVENGTLEILGELDSATVWDLKRLIQQKFSIPRCFQKLYYDERILLDENTTLSQHWIREDDAVVVEYDTTADVDKMLELIKYIIEVEKAVKLNINQWCFAPVNVPKMFSTGITNDISNIIQNYCMGRTLRYRANRHVFACNGGCQHLVGLYKLVLDRSYADLPFFLRQLEGLLVRAVGITLTNYDSRLPEVQQLIIEHSALKWNLRSFLRADVPPNGKLAPPPGSNDGLNVDILTQGQQLGSIMKDAHINLSKLAKCPTLRMEIASDEACVKQLMAMGLSPTYDSVATVVTLINTLTSLARCRDTHVELTSSRVLEGVFDTLKRKLQEKHYFNNKIHLIFRQSMTTLFTLLLTQSASIIPLPLKLKINTFISNVFLQNAVQPLEHYQNSCTEDLLWAFFSLVYSPKDLTEEDYTESHNSKMKNLRELCLKLGLVNIHDEVSANKTVVQDIIKEDYLTDYVTCLPWYMEVKGMLREKMEVLMELVCSEVPSLQNLCKAKLARNKFGLQNVLFLSVQELAIQYNDCC